jgi:hypothetical protein
MDMWSAETTLLPDPSPAAVALTDAARDHATGLLPAFAEIAVGFAVGALALVVVIAVIDCIRHRDTPRSSHYLDSSGK